MPSPAFAVDLATYGPAACRQAAGPAPSIADSQAYCRRLARTHYENFAVASWLLPRSIARHFYPIYSYCRWADDLADETADPAESLRLLDWWEEQLDLCFAGRARHPVFVALHETIRACQIPKEPFAQLLVAFRQDQRITRYETFDELLAYCRNSANPVGRLVLYLARCHDPCRAAWSDSVCTGLQLANFWQDVADDYARGRIYLPWEDCLRFGYTQSSFAAGDQGPEFRGLMAFEVDRAECFLRSGLPLAESMPRPFEADVWLFIHAGLRILKRIRSVDYDVWHRRPRLARFDHLALLGGFLWRRLRFRRK